MSESISVKVLCNQCKNFVDLGYEEIDDELEYISSCGLGRYNEHREAEKNNWLTECEYWE